MDFAAEVTIKADVMENNVSRRKSSHKRLSEINNRSGVERFTVEPSFLWAPPPPPLQSVSIQGCERVCPFTQDHWACTVSSVSYHIHVWHTSTKIDNVTDSHLFCSNGVPGVLEKETSRTDLWLGSYRLGGGGGTSAVYPLKIPNIIHFRVLVCFFSLALIVLMSCRRSWGLSLKPNTPGWRELTPSLASPSPSSPSRTNSAGSWCPCQEYSSWWDLWSLYNLLLFRIQIVLTPFSCCATFPPAGQKVFLKTVLPVIKNEGLFCHSNKFSVFCGALHSGLTVSLVSGHRSPSSSRQCLPWWFSVLLPWRSLPPSTGILWRRTGSLPRLALVSASTLWSSCLWTWWVSGQASCVYMFCQTNVSCSFHLEICSRKCSLSSGIMLSSFCWCLWSFHSVRSMRKWPTCWLI